MATDNSIVPPRVPFTDSNGVINREWFIFLNRVVNKIGGTGGVALPADIAAALAAANAAAAAALAAANSANAANAAIVVLDGAAVHKTGLLTESINGLKTFLTSPLALLAAGAYFKITDTAQALPAGSWALESTGNAFRVIKNTSATGDFSTKTVPLSFSAADIATFLSRVAGADAAAATDFVTKQQLDAKVYGGHIANTGSASVTYGPIGWTVSRASTGNTTVTHNLGTTSYSVGVSTNADSSADRNALYFNRTSNSFGVLTTIATTAAAVDEAYSFQVVRN